MNTFKQFFIEVLRKIKNIKKIFCRGKKLENQKDYIHKYSGITISKELSQEEKEYIQAMYGWKEFVQIPMLTEKIIILEKRIKKLNSSTSFFSIVLIILTVFLVILTVFLVFLTYKLVK
jgi:hypothetical protein